MSRELLYFLLGLLFTIPLNVISNIVTRKYDDVMAKRSVTVREKQLKTLISRYGYIKNLYNDKHYALLNVLSWIFRIFRRGIIIAIMLWSTAMFLQRTSSESENQMTTVIAIILISVTYFYAFQIFRQIYVYQRYLSDLMYFLLYKKEVFEQVEKLGGNVELLNENDSVPF